MEEWVYWNSGEQAYNGLTRVLNYWELNYVRVERVQK